MTAIDIEVGQHVCLIQFVDVCGACSKGLWSNYLAVNLTAVGLHKLSNLACRPDATGIGRCPVGFVLNGYSIKFYSIVAHVLHIVVKIYGIVVPVFALQLTYRAVLVLSIDGAVSLPLCRLSPRRCKDYETFLLGILGCGQRLPP